jgi:hypothetical protein
LALSGTYNFASTQSNALIDEAYRKIGIVPDLIVGEKLVSAQMSANLILSEWMNRGLNLWTLQEGMINLFPNQNSYQLPSYVSKLQVACTRTSIRQNSGTAFSSAGGIAQNAFDGNPATACTQTSPDGYISFNYGNNNLVSIQMVGIQSNSNTTYTPVCEYSNDNINWTLALSIPAQSFVIGQNVWFVIPDPTPAQYFRIRETGGATLNIQELYFNNIIQDIPMSEISHYEYWKLPFKNQTGRPTSFYVDRQISPILRIWPTPTAQFNNLFYTYERMMQDIGQQINSVEIPQRFYNAFVDNLALQLAVKYSPDKISYLSDMAERSFTLAAKEDVQHVPIRIFGSYLSGWVYE